MVAVVVPSAAVVVVELTVEVPAVRTVVGRCIVLRVIVVVVGVRVRLIAAIASDGVAVAVAVAVTVTVTVAVVVCGVGRQLVRETAR